MRFHAIFLAAVVGIAGACSTDRATDRAADRRAPAEPDPLEPRPSNATAYEPDTVRRFRDLVHGPAWEGPTWNARGTLETIHARTGLTFVLVPSGAFLMGSPDGESAGYCPRHTFESERPRHRVSPGAFLLSRTECTQAAWARGGGTVGPRIRGQGMPVENVSWTACRRWCDELGLRLPTESEWEYACRAGATTRFWSGDEETDLARVGWCRGNSGGTSHPGGEKPANPFGLTDMHGNVAEWCEDRWHATYGEPGRPDDGGAWTRGGEDSRVFRGGSWNDTGRTSRAADRRPRGPENGCGHLGFRPAASLPE